MEKVLTVMCGLPRSGKSTWTENNRKNEVVVSADEIRKLVYGQGFWGEGEPLMWAIRGMILRMLLKQGVNVIIDETNTTEERREPILKIAKEFGYHTTCVLVITPAAECMERAIDEGQKNLLPVIQRMSDNFQVPSLDEGFDEIIEYY